MSEAPLIKRQLGNVSVAVFRREASRLDGSTFTVNDFVLQKSWRDKEGQWQQASLGLDRDEAPRAIEALRAAFTESFERPAEDE